MVKTLFYNTTDKKVSHYEEIVLKQLLEHDYLFHVDGAAQFDRARREPFDSSLDWVKNLVYVSDADIAAFKESVEKSDTPQRAEGIEEIVAEARKVAQDSVKANLNAGFQSSNGINNVREQAAIVHFIEYWSHLNSSGFNNDTLIDRYRQEKEYRDSDLWNRLSSIYANRYGLNATQTATLKRLINYAINYGVKKDAHEQYPINSVFS